MSFEDKFKLNKDELNLLLNIEAYITTLDIQKTSSKDDCDLKKKWFSEWKSTINNNVAHQGYGTKIHEDFNLLTNTLREYSKNNRLKTLLIFFEASIFRPYFNLNDRSLKGLKKLKMIEGTQSSALENLALQTNIEHTIVLETVSLFEQAVEGLKEGSSLFQMSKFALPLIAAIAVGVTGGVLAPVIGGIIGSLMGLSGAAAVSAGLALLGGGALAAGGLGMAGGTFVLIGGGAVLGGISGFVFSSNLFLQNKIVLSQLAKLEAVIKGIFKGEKDLDLTIKKILQNYQDVVDQLNSLEEQLNLELVDLESSLAAAEDEIVKKDLQKAIKQIKERLKAIDTSKKYYSKAIERLSPFFLEVSINNR